MTSRNSELEAAIERDPDDREAYRVYADWLEGHGDPRAALIRAQLAEPDANDPTVDHARKPVRKLLVEQREALLGPLFVHAKSLTWRYGFLRSAKLKDTGGSCTPHLEYLLDSLSGRFLVELEVRTTDLGAVARRLSRLPATLRALALSHDGPAIDLEALPPLTQLSLEGRFELGALPALERAKLRIFALSAASARAIAAAPLARLQRLELGLAGSTAPAGDLAAILERATHLAELAFPHATAPLADQLAAAVVEAPLAATLERLELPGLTDAGARTLATRRTAFARLRHLDVQGGALTEDGWTLLDTMNLDEIPQWDRYEAIQE